MRRSSIDNLINGILFLYILSLYLFTYREGYTTYSNLLAMVLVLTIVFRIIIFRRKLVFNWLLITHLIFICICAMSTFYAIEPVLAATKTRTLVLVYVTMIALINYIDSYDKVRNVMTYFIYSGFIASIYILMHSDFGQLNRFGSVLGNVNAVGMILGISAVFCFSIMINERKFSFVLLLSVILPTILLTGSRKSLLFVIMSIAIMLWLRNKTDVKGTVKFVIISILLITVSIYTIMNVPLFYQILGRRMLSLVSFITGEGTLETSVNIRSHMMSFGLMMFGNKPLNGYGIDNYRVLYGYAIGDFGTYAHNNYVELLVNVGILGLVAYYLTHVVVLKRLFRSETVVRDASLNYVFISIIFAYITLAVSLVYYDNKHFSLVLALASVVPKYKANEIKKAK